jgi:uncharacterized protein
MVQRDAAALTRVPHASLSQRGPGAKGHTVDSVGTELLALLAGCAFVIGVVDAIAGAGGLLTVPLLLSLGFEPASALATNKLQGVFGTGSSTVAFARAGLVQMRVLMPAAACAALAAGVGTIASVRSDPGTLRYLIAVLLIVVAVYFLFAPRIGDDDGVEVRAIARSLPVAAGAIGFYDGFLGLGTGTFFMTANATLLRRGLRTATANAKFLNFCSNVGSLALFLLSGKIVWTAGVAMALGQIIGARVGARLVVREGARMVRPVVVAAAIAMAIRLLVLARLG